MPRSNDQPTIPATSTLPSTSTKVRSTLDPTTRTSSGGSSSVEESTREDSGGAGNESDDEREPTSGSGGQTTRDDSDEQVSQLTHHHHHEMYPFPSTSHHQFQRHSSAEVEASSAGSMSTDLSSEEEEDLDGDVKMDDAKPIAMPKRTLSEYRASLSRAGLAAPPKIRRLGALGISVHSESDIENPQVSGLDTNDRIDPASGGDTSAGTRETDLGVSFAALQETSGSRSPSGVVKVPKRRKRGVADSTFRGIVDELALENRQLKDKLRRYEAHGVPVELKDSRLFEIRFYDGLPIDQRTELETFLTTYVREFIERGPSSPSPKEPSQVSQLPSPLECPPPPQPRTKMSTSLPSPQESESSTSNLGAQNLPPAESSNSGLEPFSFSGVGSGVYRPNDNSFSRASRSLSHPPSLPVPAILTQQDRELAKSVINSLEKLFRHSLMQNEEEESSPPSAQRSRSNETYMANFLSHDFLSGGWVYLNLASTMAELHHYSVTLNFVQQAVRDHSKNLQVSEDGKRIRWIGAAPLPSPPPTGPPSSDRPTPAPKTEAPSRRAVKIASPAPTESQASSGATTATQGSLNSSDPSSDNVKSSKLANSIAQTASTAPTSQAPSRSNHSKPNPRPQRPTAAVLQRMDRLSPPTTSAQQLPLESARSSPPKRSLSHPQPSLSFVAHPDSSMRQAPQIFHRLLRNKLEEEVEYAKEELPRPGQAIPKGPGMLVYYANGHFCSDLTQEEAKPDEVDVEQPFFLGGLEDGTAAKSDYSDPPSSNIDLDDEVDLLDLQFDSPDEVMSGGEEERASVNSHGSSLRRLSVSGMTTTIPADLFTILVKMNHPSKRPRTQSDAPSSTKKRRLAGQPPRILSSKAYHHRPLMTKRGHPINVDGNSSGDEIIARPHLTASNLAKHTHPTLASITPPLDNDIPAYVAADTPSPPHDDYLLSLAAPLHAWAPRETNSVSQSPPIPPRSNAKNHLGFHHRRLVKPYPARTVSDMSTTTGDERPISLDDMVGPGLVR